ncbi:unnamed protein product [Rotaria magnacalcarata]|uniref:Uncharacterized protein n=1 Tax=Rotaria magnacalcarata TaxID=392030 RepID=A0A816MGT6_9BILA|nr:unnamed protein product [Rotaria magnacalcarata]CAF2104769.1 unnamed protein product [Rotaria magnacalcarata]
MDLSWVMCLCMLTWLSLFSLVKTNDYGFHEMEYDEETTTIRMSSRSKSSTKAYEKTTLHSDVGYAEDDADVSHEEEEDIHHTTPTITKSSSTFTTTVTTQVITETLTTTTTTSSSSTTRPTTHAITKSSSSTLGVTTQTITKIPVTYSTWNLSTRIYNIDLDELANFTPSPKQIAAYLAKIRRDRLLLKIFAIGVVVFMLSLSVAFITIHMVRRKNRYNGYRTPANIPFNGH